LEKSCLHLQDLKAGASLLLIYLFSVINYSTFIVLLNQHSSKHQILEIVILRFINTIQSFISSSFKMVNLSTLTVIAAFFSIAMATPFIEPAPTVPSFTPTSPEYYLKTKVLSGDASKDGLYGTLSPSPSPPDPCSSLPSHPIY
jgi:hypothetical protein